MSRRGLQWRGDWVPRDRDCYFFTLPGSLHRLECGKLDVVEFAIFLLDLADIDVLHDVARFGIYRNGPARAFPAIPFMAAISESPSPCRRSSSGPRR